MPQNLIQKGCPFSNGDYAKEGIIDWHRVTDVRTYENYEKGHRVSLDPTQKCQCQATYFVGQELGQLNFECMETHVPEEIPKACKLSVWNVSTEYLEGIRKLFPPIKEFESSV
ncbi:MAG: hypothetical protein PHU12_01600 [Candidatus Aenigmarchaeota archaeon]|nr:hypothetical protein [Candidatus Aenigmarchaeota archaeon]